MAGTHIVTADWLEARLGSPGLSVLDVSWYLADRNARDDHAARHVPGAGFFDQDGVVEPGVNLPNALPSPEVFAAAAGALGVTADDTVVVYDAVGFRSAPRAWWLFRTMGVRQVHVLEGGLDRWVAEGRPVESGPVRHTPRRFVPRFDAKRVATLEQMKARVVARASQIVDARVAPRFTGAEAAPQPGTRRGHIPGACNIPSAMLSRDGTLLPPAELRAIFDAAGIDLGREVISYCGSGIAAATVILALEVLGHRDHKLYDGSWSEWGTLDETARL